MLKLALFQPDIAANTGTMARLCACFAMKLTVIEPAGFAWDDSKLRRAGMDYLDMAAIRRSASWEHFRTEAAGRRIVLLSTRAALPYTRFRFAPDDILLMGRESAGVPDHVHEGVDARITIPMAAGARSLNVAIAAGIAVSEALRQCSSAPVPT